MYTGRTHIKASMHALNICMLCVNKARLLFTEITFSRLAVGQEIGCTVLLQPYVTSREMSLASRRRHRNKVNRGIERL